MEPKWISYDTNVEVFIALRDVNLYYSPRHHPNSRQVAVKHVALTVVAYWKPPAALQWVEKCVTETVFKNRSPSFAVKMHIQCESKDVHAVALKFELRDKSFGMGVMEKFSNSLASVETTLSALLEAKSKGLLLQLPYYTFTTCNTLDSDPAELHQISPGQCFLRAETLKPCDQAVLLQFALLLKKPTKCRKVYCLEIHKLNEEGLFQLQQPYTLIHRSEILRDPARCGFWHHINVPLSRLCNGDLERVLKLVVYDPDKTPVGSHSGTGFALTTLRRLLTDSEKRLPLIRTKDGKISEKGCLFINEYTKIVHPSVEYYMKKGLTFRPIYAVEFSTSNWNLLLHKRSLHDAREKELSNFEEALEMTVNAVEGLTEGDSVFYSFGGPNTKPFVSTFADTNQLEGLRDNYTVSLCTAKMAMQNLQVKARKSPQSFQIRSNSLSTTAHLTPLLIDLIGLINLRKDLFEYFIVFIFTDGEIGDLEKSMHKLIEVAKLPVSIIFIAVGQGNLSKLLALQKEWKHPTTRQSPCRNISTVIHFRSLLDWNTSIKFAGHFATKPEILFQKEIMNCVERQLGRYMRITHPYC